MRYIAMVFSFLFLGAHTASAHVAYVVPASSLANKGGIDFAFFFSPLQNINYYVIVLCTFLMIVAIYYLGHHIPLLIKEFAHIKRRLINYGPLVPWILRLGLGILFIGAAFHHVFISPIMSDIGNLAPYELVIGFSLLVGFLITPSILAIIGFYLVALFHDGYILGNLEVLGSAIALFLLADGRPGFDDIAGAPTLIRAKFAKYVPLVLRITLGSAFIFLAFYEKIFNPHYFTSVVENYHLTSVIPVSAAMWTFSVGMIELLVGLFILFGFKTRITSVVAFFVVTTTFFFFKEDIYSHVSIFAVLSVLFITGGGKYSIDEHIEHSLLPKPTTQVRRKIASTTSKSSTKKVVKKTTARKTKTQ
ncbi:MAG: hypothetical protein RL641_344 [Candidatus Parcubacteria bacterium]|jgi:uncharacterized membrane protein YphA (DoxX/SURF4 family)